MLTFNHKINNQSVLFSEMKAKYSWGQTSSKMENNKLAGLIYKPKHVKWNISSSKVYIAKFSKKTLWKFFIKLTLILRISLVFYLPDMQFPNDKIKNLNLVRLDPTFYFKYIGMFITKYCLVNINISKTVIYIWRVSVLTVLICIFIKQK